VIVAKLWSNVTGRSKDSCSQVGCEPPERDKPDHATLLPHNRCGKTGQSVTVGEKVPEGRMRGPPPTPAWPICVPLTPTLSPALKAVRVGKTASGGEGASR
jgi:hypothetical protein